MTNGLSPAFFLGVVLEDVEDELGGPPTLDEFLEILDVSVPVPDEHLAPVGQPVRFRAEVSGARPGNGAPSRVPELNDVSFVDATDLLGALAETVAADRGRPASLEDLATALAPLLRTVAFADIDGARVTRVTATAPRVERHPGPGDLVAIPAPGGHRLALLLERNPFGTALGLFAGTHPDPQSVDRAALRPAADAPVHTDDRLFADGTWSVLGTDATLRRLFPAEVEIYHAPPSRFPGVDLGEFCAAETAAGALRLIDAAEAERVGLRSGRYQQVLMSGELQRRLADTQQ